MHHKLYIARKENRLKQKDLANELQIHKVTYCRKENGEAEFTLSEAFKLANRFDTTVDELFGNKLY